MEYIDYLAGRLNAVKDNLSITNNIIVADEQMFAKIKDFEPTNIYVVIKKLSSTIAYDGRIIPVQLMVLSEANSAKVAFELMNEFASVNNLSTYNDGDNLVKQMYNTPQVVSNYTPVAYGFNSLIYVSGTLYVLENIIDLTTLKIDTNLIEVSSFNCAYAMTGNTQPIGGDKISSTVKSVATFNVSFVLPMIDRYSTLITKVLNIMNNTNSGNTDFVFSFTIGSASFSYNMKLTGATFTTAPNSAPSLQLGFMV